MKLPKLAMTVLALSMSAAWAGGYGHDKAKQQSNAPAGYGDQSHIATQSIGAQDTRRSQDLKDGGMADRSSTPAVPSAPAGYADSAPSATGPQGPQDTQRAQPELSARVGASSSSALQGNAPVGYADQSNIATGSTLGAQDTGRSQSGSGSSLSSADGASVATTTTATADTAQNVEVIDLRTVRDRDPGVAERERMAGSGNGTTLGTAESAPANAPAGFADKPSITSDTVGAQDTQAAQRTIHGSSGLATPDAPQPHQPAGYADKSPLATEAKGAQDTEDAQATWRGSASGTSGEVGAPANAPAGYADKSNIATEEKGPQDTRKAQSNR